MEPVLHPLGPVLLDRLPVHALGVLPPSRWPAFNAAASCRRPGQVVGKPADLLAVLAGHCGCLFFDELALTASAGLRGCAHGRDGAVRGPDVPAGEQRLGRPCGLGRRERSKGDHQRAAEAGGGKRDRRILGRGGNRLAPTSQRGLAWGDEVFDLFGDSQEHGCEC
eukprot:11995789-Prorocentrum_lima.AAC.1